MWFNRDPPFGGRGRQMNLAVARRGAIRQLAQAIQAERETTGLTMLPGRD